MVIAAPFGGPGGGIQLVPADGGVDAHAAVGDEEVLAVEEPVHDEGGGG